MILCSDIKVVFLSAFMRNGVAFNLGFNTNYYIADNGYGLWLEYVFFFFGSMFCSFGYRIAFIYKFYLRKPTVEVEIIFA